MRLLFLSTGIGALLLGSAAVWAQNTGESESAPQLPVGQTFKNFEYPIYQEGKLKATLSATSATGITLNRAETIDLKIDSYENGAVSTTVTSPKADLYVAEQKMRTKNTVSIDRPDMTATAQTCDFNLKTKRYLLRTNVKVVLKHFDVSLSNKNTPPVSNATPSSVPTSALPKPRPEPEGSMLDNPGGYSDTNAAPIVPQH